MQCADHTASADSLGIAERSVTLRHDIRLHSGIEVDAQLLPSVEHGRAGRAPPRGPQPALITTDITYVWLSRANEAPLLF